MTTSALPNPAIRSRKRVPDDFEWETSKENVMPLKRGRNVADLNKALREKESIQTKLQLEDGMKLKEDAIASYDGDDPLANWLEYVRWLEVKMPEDTRKKFKVLEKCTRELKDNPRYRNDIRYIRLWIQYADLVSNPKDIFKYLYQNKIGEHVSLFYIGWAYVLETIANYPQAHKIYLKASQKNAKPQDLLERKYKEFQRRMSRQWLKMTEETGISNIEEVNHRRALESLPAYPAMELNDVQRQQLHQHQASARAQRIQKVDEHKPVFIVYEDPVVNSADLFGGNCGWKKLDTLQQQDKENDLAVSVWNSRGDSTAMEAGRPPERQPLSTPRSHSSVNALQVFVDDEFCVHENELERRTPLTHRYQTMRQRMDGVVTEEEMLAQEPLKNFLANAQGERQKLKNRIEKPCYDVEQIKCDTGEALSFEEIRARAYNDKRCRIGQSALQDLSSDIDSAFNVNVSAATKPPSVLIDSGPFLSKQKLTSRDMKINEPKNASAVVTSPNALAAVHDGDQEDMTITTRVALEDINTLFCSPPRQPMTAVREVKEHYPVERRLLFSVYDDSVKSVATSVLKQSQRQHSDESIQPQTYHGFEDFQKGRNNRDPMRKPLGARDDLMKSGRLTNKDALIQAEEETVAKKSTGR
ncbi:hypothetical protein PsorP6_002457 [Peronosclerospora sorghi]|uniref:Uncharacterized protein n=1 Tax=Peronosclerospora sorghi TaxID=230839 RepID=A0ACC0WXG9_9STRA|nr:hypothetical protein PsorP6_002457 [Peronosclerospora sorghi]